MTSFLDMDKPKRTEEFIVIVKSIKIVEDGYCTQMVGNGLCNMPTTWQCVICNQWTCDLHEHPTQFTQPGRTLSYAVCESCGKLSKSDLELIYHFQTEMNRE